MTWRKYYDKFYDWSESMQISQISSISDFHDASAAEIIETAMYMDDEAALTRLVRKALYSGIHFSSDEVLEIIDWLRPDFRLEFAQRASTSYTDEQLDLLISSLSDEDVRSILRQYLSAPTISMPSQRKENYFDASVRYEEAHPPKSSKDTMKRYRELNQPEAKTTTRGQKNSANALKSILFVVFLPISIFVFVIAGLVKDKTKPSPPPHYGYRYGRRYYGRGHTRGCSETGNKCK